MRYFEKEKEGPLGSLVVGRIRSVAWDDVSLTLAEKDEGRTRRRFWTNPNWEEGLARSQAPSPTLAGQLAVGRPTLEALHIEWPIVGDFNRNGRVEVKFRKQGETAGRGAPLLRKHARGDQPRLPGGWSMSAPTAMPAACPA